MFAVFADGAESRDIVVAALDGVPARVTATWHEVAAAAEGARAAALIIPDLMVPSARALVQLREERPLLPLVLVTAGTPVNARRLALLPSVDVVLFLDEAREGLPKALEEAAGFGALFRASDAVLERRSPPTLLVQALATACRRRWWIRTVRELAEEVAGYSVSRFRQLWREEAAPGTKPHDFIDWLLVTRACAEWRVGEPQGVLARRLGVDRHVLADAIERRFGVRDLGRVVPRMPEIALDDLTRMLGLK